MIAAVQTEGNKNTTGADAMRTHYDFPKMKARRNPYPKLPKQSVTIRLDRDTVGYLAHDEEEPVLETGSCHPALRRAVGQVVVGTGPPWPWLSDGRQLFFPTALTHRNCNQARARCLT
jgi:hypothetical protein